MRKERADDHHSSPLGSTTPHIPPPITGGTFHYCPWRERIKGGVVSCGVRKWGWATGTRFRTLAAYRRHWRKCHTPAAVALAHADPVFGGATADTTPHQLIVMANQLQPEHLPPGVDLGVIRQRVTAVTRHAHRSGRPRP